MLFIAGADYTYADLESQGSYRGRKTWFNPLNGTSVTLGGLSFYLTDIPGLRWRFNGMTNTGLSKFELILSRQLIYPRGSRQHWLYEYQLTKTGECTMCGRSFAEGMAIGNKGEAYQYISFETSLADDKRPLTVTYVTKEQDHHITVDESLFCPLVESFPAQNEAVFTPEHGRWHNPFSDKTSLLFVDTQVRVDDIVSHQDGSWQAYTLSFDEFTVEITKIRFYPDTIRADEMEQKGLLQDIKIDWANTAYLLSDYHTPGFTERQAVFHASLAGGEQVTGLIYDRQKYGERTLMKIWSRRESDLINHWSEWARQLFNSIIDDESHS